MEIVVLDLVVRHRVRIEICKRLVQVHDIRTGFSIVCTRKERLAARTGAPAKGHIS